MLVEDSGLVYFLRQLGKLYACCFLWSLDNINNSSLTF